MMKRTRISVLLCALVATSICVADQETFNLRSEQSLRPHDFDVTHYRIALTLNEENQRFEGKVTSGSDHGKQMNC